MADDTTAPGRQLEVRYAGNGTPIDVVTAELAAGMGGDRQFSPGMPMRPAAGYSVTPRSWDYTTGYNIAARPRAGERVAFDTLKGLIDAYDVAQMCIWHRIDSLRSLKWELVAADWYGGRDITGFVNVGKAALRRPDRRTRFKPWLTAYAYDILAYDAGALYRMRNNAGRAIGLKVVDGTTIAPLLDVYGDTPMRETTADPAPPAFVQFANGIPWTSLTTDDLIYEPFRGTSGSPYGKAPIETILLNANTDLRFQQYFIQRFTEGNVPEAFATSPEGWSPDQIREFQDAWDAFMLGNEAGKHQMKWVPNGTEIAWSNEKEFEDNFSLFLMRKTAAAYHVTPQDLGFTEDVNRATSETQSDNQFRVGDLPLIEHIQDILTDFLQEDLGLPLEFQFDTGQEKEDRLNTAQADKIYVEMGAISSSEVRERVYGLSEPDGQLVPRFIFSNRAGPIPLSALFAVAGPVDEENAAPLPGAELPHKPFSPVEGVAPQKLPDAPPLAVQRYPADNPAAADQAVQSEVTAATPVPVITTAPVAKEGAGPGITVVDGTVPTSYDLAGQKHDDEDEVAKAAELASFRRFTAGRRKAGRWRDFQFTTVTPHDAERLNRAGRTEIRKAAGEIIAGGLAVRAADTGRVLMLQRGLDPTDPASGTWEFPGGCLDDGETPLAAAVREWQEEVGLLLPADAITTVTQGWTSGDGVYCGFVGTIAAESLVNFGDRGQVRNPDDPDGDVIEAIAWWDPSLLPGNPALRDELAASITVACEAIAPAVVAKAGGVDPKAPSWRDGAPKVPQHAYDLRITDHFAPLITAALRGVFGESMLRAAVEQVSSMVVKAPGGDTDLLREAARAAIAGGDVTGLEQVLRDMYASSYAAGGHAATEQFGTVTVSSLAGVSDVDWGAWAPGDPAAAGLLSNGGLQDLLQQAGFTVQGVTDTLLEQIGNVIGDGVAGGRSVDSITSDLTGVIDDPARAERIAYTETARAVTAATTDTYAANGLDQFEWVLSDGACPACEDEAAANPHRLIDAAPPLHPYCRCAAAPVLATPE